MLRVVIPILALTACAPVPREVSECLAGSRICDGEAVLVCDPGKGTFLFERICEAPAHCVSGACVGVAASDVPMIDAATDVPGPAPDVVEPNEVLDDSGAEDPGAADPGPPDPGPADEGAPDPGPHDMGPTDTGPPDTGPPDTGPPDTGPTDTGPPDTGPPDTGPEDTGPPDIGPEDMGAPDPGPPDTGPVDPEPGLLIYEKVANIEFLDDFRHVRWLPYGEWAVLLGAKGDLVRYDPATGALTGLLQLTGSMRDLEVSAEGDFVLVARVKTDGSSELLRFDVAGDTLVEAESIPLSQGEVQAVVRGPPGEGFLAVAHAKNGGGYITYLHRWSPDGELVPALKAWASGAGAVDAMFIEGDLYGGAPAVMTSEGINGADSHTWIIPTNKDLSNGFNGGNTGAAGWRPGGNFGMLTGTSTNSLYVYDGAWEKPKLPGTNSGAATSGIAWRADGSRALIVGRATGNPLSGTVIELRPSGDEFLASDLIHQGIPGFDKAPWHATFSTHLWDADWRPASACHEGLIVGTDNGSGLSPTFGLVIRFYDVDNPSCSPGG